MRVPTREAWKRAQPQGIVFCLGWMPTANARFYKYSWQIWTPASALEGYEFLESGPCVSTAEFMTRQGQMEKHGLAGWVYSRKSPRQGPGTPFDRNHPKWREAEFAPSWDDDVDPEWNGHK
jgi:hypothetical protein